MKTSHERSVFESRDESVAAESRRPRNMLETLRNLVRPTGPLPAQRIFQSVTTGLLGDASFRGGWRTAALGVAPHFVISITIAVVYYLVALRWSLLWRKPSFSGTI